jgi:hypothetical protein
MSDPTRTFNQFSEADIRSLEPAMKIGILATVNPESLPHLTMISTLKACSPGGLSFGQFTEGTSKAHLRQNPKAGWLVMTLDKSLWRGAAVFKRTATDGPEYDFYNSTPLFRYNAYFGIHTVYYLDLVAHSGKTALPMKRIIPAALQTILARALSGKRGGRAVLNPWTVSFLNRLNCLKFASYVGGDGFPVIIPVIQAQAAGSERILFAASVYRRELEAIPAGVPLALFGLSLDMEDVLLRGEYEGLRRIAGVRCGSLRVSWVYNSMPPVPGQIYPELPLQPVRDF